MMHAMCTETLQKNRQMYISVLSLSFILFSFIFFVASFWRLFTIFCFPIVYSSSPPQEVVKVTKKQQISKKVPPPKKKRRKSAKKNLL